LFFLRGAVVVLVCLLTALPGRAEARLTTLAPEPDWSQLDPYQQTITRAEFVRQINTLYAPNGFFWKYAQLGDDRVVVFADTLGTIPLYTLYFAQDAESRRPRPRYFRPESQANTPPPPADQPLAGIHICLDPGHIGGEWSRLEERWFRLGTDNPVAEAELNLLVCRHLERLLKEAGARVSWTKKDLQPVTPQRPRDFHSEALKSLLEAGASLQDLTPGAVARRVQARAEIIFYRTAEIQARTKKVTALQPDLTLCIHYNADSWGNPDKPQLTKASRLVTFVNGCYTEREMAYDDMKFALLSKLLSGAGPLELKGADSVAREMALSFGHPPEPYPHWEAVKQVGRNPYVFARNLIANRLYPGPVVYVEGPYMNAKDTYARLIAGDYEGTRLIQGKEVPSIHRQYAEAVAKSVRDYFKKK
jgi:hypothetical protein